MPKKVKDEDRKEVLSLRVPRRIKDEVETIAASLRMSSSEVGLVFMSLAITEFFRAQIELRGDSRLH
jgi:hypothetical protein